MGIRTQFGAVALSALALLGGTSAHAYAGSVTFGGTISGSVDGNSFSDASFTAVATFRWDSNLVPGPAPIASYPSIGTFTLTGDPSYAGTYTSAAGAELFSVLLQPAYTGNGTYGFELQDDADGTVGAFYTSQTYVPLATELLWSGLTNPFQSGSFDVPLVGGGDLTISSFGTLGPDLSIGVPEPGTLILLGFGAAITGLGHSRRRRAFPSGWWYREPPWRQTHTRRRISTAQPAGL
ncbi:MAG TPA: PEP-CTERM sorting domain-containing protein [Acetobacteraceae bacterium]|jgi:hypothetical protein